LHQRFSFQFPSFETVKNQTPTSHSTYKSPIASQLPTITMISVSKSFSTAMELATELCSDSVKIEGLGLIAKLTPEIVLTIFDNLNAPTSTCLGLTCKYFYKIHCEYHGSVCLATHIEGTTKILRNLIAGFIGWFHCEEDFDEVDHIFRPVTKVRTLGNRRFNELSNKNANFVDDHMYVSNCICKGSNGVSTVFKRDWERKSEQERRRRGR
jgi:hypothetical protein